MAEFYNADIIGYPTTQIDHQHNMNLIGCAHFIYFIAQPLTVYLSRASRAINQLQPVVVQLTFDQTSVKVESLGYGSAVRFSLKYFCYHSSVYL